MSIKLAIKNYKAVRDINERFSFKLKIIFSGLIGLWEVTAVEPIAPPTEPPKEVE